MRDRNWLTPERCKGSQHYQHGHREHGLVEMASSNNNDDSCQHEAHRVQIALR